MSFKICFVVCKVKVTVRVHIIRIQLLSTCTDLLILLQPNIVLWYIIIIVACVQSYVFLCHWSLCNQTGCVDVLLLIIRPCVSQVGIYWHWQEHSDLQYCKAITKIGGLGGGGLLPHTVTNLVFDCVTFFIQKCFRYWKSSGGWGGFVVVVLQYLLTKGGMMVLVHLVWFHN